MSLPEGYLPRKGDVLILLAVVEHDVDPGERVFVKIDGQYGSGSTDLGRVAGLHRRCWNEGERIETDGGSVGTVVAINDDAVWVKTDSGDMMTVHANSLRPGPAAVQEPAPVPEAAPPPFEPEPPRKRRFLPESEAVGLPKIAAAILSPPAQQETEDDVQF